MVDTSHSVSGHLLVPCVLVKLVFLCRVCWSKLVFICKHVCIFSTGSACSPPPSRCQCGWTRRCSLLSREGGHSVNLTQLVFPVRSGTLIVLSDCLLVFLFSLILQQFQLFSSSFFNVSTIFQQFSITTSIFSFFQRFLAKVTRLHVTPFDRDDWIPQANATCCGR